MGEDLEVFPVCIALKSRDLWFGWISAEPWDYFISDSYSIAWSLTRAGLLGKISQIKASYIVMDDSFFDLDGALKELRDGRVVDANLVLNLWNIFSDFYNTISSSRVSLFCPEERGAYEALFANSDSAGIVGIERSRIRAHHLQSILKVMEVGSEMLFNSTIDLKQK